MTLEALANSMLSLLLAEDQALIALATQLSLEGWGYHVCGVAQTADQVVALADRHRPDLALIDVRLAAGSDGLTAARELLHRYGIHSIVISAHVTMEDARNAQAVGYLAKPVRPEKLKEMIEVVAGWLGGSEPQFRPPGFIGHGA